MLLQKDRVCCIAITISGTYYIIHTYALCMHNIYAVCMHGHVCSDTICRMYDYVLYTYVHDIECQNVCKYTPEPQEVTLGG